MRRSAEDVQEHPCDVLRVDLDSRDACVEIAFQGDAPARQSPYVPHSSRDARSAAKARLRLDDLTYEPD